MLEEGEDEIDGQAQPLKSAIAQCGKALQGLAVPRFVELYSCCTLSLLPGLACSIHTTWDPPFS